MKPLPFRCYNGYRKHGPSGFVWVWQRAIPGSGLKDCVIVHPRASQGAVDFLTENRHIAAPRVVYISNS